MKRQWENEDLIEHWMLSTWDLGQLSNKTGATRLGFAILLKFFQHAGRFPTFKNDIPGTVISFVATQVGVTPEAYLQYDWQGRTIKDHRAEIRRLLDFRESTVADAEQMQQWLIAEVLPQEHQDDRLREEAYAWFRHMHLEAPTSDRLTRLIRSAAHSFEQQFYDTTLASLPMETQTALEALLLTEIAILQESRDESQIREGQESIVQVATQEIEDEPTMSPLHLIRQDPGRIGLATMLEEMAKLRRIRELKLPENFFPGVARKVLWQLVGCAFSFCWYHASHPCSRPMAEEMEVSEAEVLTHTNVPAPAPAVGTGGGNQRGSQSATARVLAGGLASGARMVRALGHAEALLASVVRAAPTTSTTRLP